MYLLDRLCDIARQRNRKIVLPEGDDPRIVAAATRLRDQHWRGRPCSARHHRTQDDRIGLKVSLDGLRLSIQRRHPPAKICRGTTKRAIG
jgi:phosphotransacetylase